MNNLLLILMLVLNAPFAQSRHAPAPGQQQTVTTQAHQSVYSAMIDRSQMVPGRCYIGMPVTGAGVGWFETTITNDTPAPVRVTIDGISVRVWKPMQMLAQTPSGQVTATTRPSTDRVIVNNGGADQESYVLNPGERCNMVLPDTRLDNAGRARWYISMEQLRASNPNGDYVSLGIQGRLHTTEYTTMFQIPFELIMFRTGDRHYAWSMKRHFR